jgi:hypothetical protein
VQLDFPCLIFRDHHGIFQIDQVIFLQLPQFQTYLFRLVQVALANDDERVHALLLARALPVGTPGSRPALKPRWSVALPEKP